VVEDLADFFILPAEIKGESLEQEKAVDIAKNICWQI
jgi:hypothetical protein